jgi:hypothetical protein
VPVGLESVILKCLQKDPARRYQTGDELAGDLASVRTGGTPQAAFEPVPGSEATLIGAPTPRPPQIARPEDQTTFGPTGPGASPGVRVVTPATQTAKPDGPRARRSNSTLALAGLGVLAVIVVAGVMYRHRVQPTAEVPPSTVTANSAASADLTAQQAASSSSAMDIPLPPPISGAAQSSSSSAPDSAIAPKEPSKGSAATKEPAKSSASSAKKGPPKSGGTPGTRIASGPVTSSASPAKIDAPLPSTAPAPIVQPPEPTPAPSKAPANPTPAPAKATPLNPNENAKLHVDAGRVPDSVGFIILMDGKPLYERTDSSSPGANEEPIIPPGQHEFRVISGHNSVKLGDSNSVRGEFQVKKKKALHIELRDAGTGKTLNRNSKVAEGEASFVIELKSGFILF